MYNSQVEISDRNDLANQITINIQINLNITQNIIPTQEQNIQCIIGNDQNNCSNVNFNNQLYDNYRSEFNNLITQKNGFYGLKLQQMVFKFTFVEHCHQIWFKIFSLDQCKVKSGIQLKMNKQQAKILHDLSKDIAITQSYNFFRQVWILRDFQIGSHTSQNILPEQQLMNLVNGQTPCGQDWKIAKDEGFMQIHGKFDYFGNQNKIRIDLPNGEHQDIKYNDFITLQIGSLNEQKWVVKFKQGQECKQMEQQVSTKFTGDKVHKSMAVWLRVL